MNFKNILKNRPVVSGLMMIALAFTFGLMYATNSTFAADTTCPTGYTLVDGTNQCNGKATYSCTYGSYDEDEGWCYHYQSCPTGYTLASNNQCISEATVKNSCSQGTYDAEKKLCYYSQSCPTGYTLASNNQCMAEPVDENGVNSCTYGTYDEDEGWCYYYLTTPSGYEIDSKTTTTMTYSGKAISEYTCTYGTYDEDEGWCYYYLTTPSGYEVFSKTTTTMTYGAKPDYNCAYGSFDEDEGWCIYYLTGNTNPSEPTNPTTSYSVYFGSLTDFGATLYKSGVATTQYTQTVSTSSINLSNYTADSKNYNFKGWSTGDCSKILTGNLTLTKTTTNLYACWERKSVENVEYYEIEFDLAGGKFPDGSSARIEIVGENEVVDSPEVNPIKDGFVFEGWYHGYNKYEFERNPEDDIILVAKWKEDTSGKKYKCNDGDVYEPKIGKCINVQKFSGKSYLESVITNTLICNNGVLEQKSTTCEGNCNKLECGAGYSYDLYRTENTCDLAKSCSTDDECVIGWKSHCFKTYDATLIVDKDIDEKIEQVQTSDITGYVIVLIMMAALGFTAYYIKDLKNEV